MANVFALQSVGEALRAYLQASFPTSLRDIHPCTFRVISSGELATQSEPDDGSSVVTLFLYRATISEHLRNLRPAPFSSDDPALPLELHWMVTVWSGTAFAEQTLYAWVRSQLHQVPLLDLGILTPEANWDDADVVHFLPEELTIEDLMRIWDAIEPGYRLSATYIARVVKIDAMSAEPPNRVVTTRLDLGEDAEAL